jgi:hypothetical protein
MKKAVSILSCLLFLSVIGGASFARETKVSGEGHINYTEQMSTKEARFEANALGGLSSSAAASTTYFATWSWDSSGNCVTDSWTTVDQTTQVGEFWHVDDFSGLGGGSFVASTRWSEVNPCGWVPALTPAAPSFAGMDRFRATVTVGIRCSAQKPAFRSVPV